MRELEAAAKSLSLRLIPIASREPHDDARAFAEISKSGAAAIVVVGGLLGTEAASGRARVVELAAKSGLPTMYAGSRLVEAGGLISYGAEPAEARFRRAAHYVDRILKGAKPADLPVETPTKFELVINLKTAERLGLTIPESVLQRADRVVQ